uniref:ABC-type xenobiotic transporter n=1 Tax=Noccaea caerulescens TaxID=107243 RepID=A0A1J3J3N2_NOCCA
MDFLGSTKDNGMLTVLFSFSESILPPESRSFLLEPLFLRWVSGFLHAVLLLVLFCSWVRDKIRRNNGYVVVTESLKYRRDFEFKSAMFCSVALSLLNLVLMSLSGFHWYESGWSDEEELVSLVGFLLGMVSWGILSICLHRCSDYEHKKSPLLIRLWLVFYLAVSCYSLVVDIVMYKRHKTVTVHLLVYNIVAFSAALFLGYVAFFKKARGNDNNGVLEEPLLNGGSSVLELDKANGSDEATPYSKAGILGLLTFSWMSPLINLGNMKALDLEDVPQLHDNDSVVKLAPKFRIMLESSDGGGERSGVTTFKLMKALFFSAQWEIIVTAFLVFIYTVASYVGPALIDTFVQYLNGRRQYNNEGYVLVITFFVAKLVECLSQRHWFFRLQKVGIRMRSSLVAMIYEKGLTLSCHSKQGRTSGEIINFMTVDAERIGNFSWYMHDPWMVLLQVGLALWILYRNLGLASLAALIATILVMLVNIPFGRMQERFQEKLMEAKDNRMKSTSEILRNMRILKLQGWEMKFLSKIFDLRKSEEGWLKKYVYNSAIISFVFWGAPTLVSVSTFGACILLGIPLESGKILSALATFRILQEPIYNLPDTISMLVQTKVSLDRIASYLCLDNLQPDVVERLPQGSSDIAVEVTNSTLSWDVSSANPTLKDINFKVFNGMKVAVCGTVGSGKSSLLSSILGEVPKICGNLKVCGTKAYVAQSPWIQSGKIEDNILFGKPMERERYEKVLEACSLKKDLEILSFGDQTVIGERGINLSGGQKQRIQIARALYQDADIYLFDDPFSAVDAHTGSHLFKEVLLGLLCSKSVIYVTHQVEFLPAADLILVMKDGRISQAGKYNDILNSGTDFMELIGAHQEALAVVNSVDTNSVSETSALGEENGVVRDDAIGFDGKQESQDLKNDKPDSGEPQRQLVQEEEREKGSVALSVYWKYITLAYGGALVPFILLAQVLFQLLQIGSNYWMAWATPVSKDVEATVNLSTLMIVYVALAVGSSLCILFRATLLVTAGYKTATELFHRMHHCIFRSPMSFFDSTPSGRIMNRASTDQSAVDLDIPYQFGSVAITVIQLIGIIGVMSQVSWLVFLVFIPVVAASIWYQRYYIAAARELSRLVGVCKAPLIQHFAETISGSTTIRSFSQESRFRSDNMRLSDGYSRPKFYSAGAMEWLCFRLDVLSSFTFAFSLVFLISIPTGVIDPSLAGLAVTYGLSLNTMQAWLIWTLCNLENKIISVERILQYASVSSEPPLVIESNRPEQSWPSRGEVDIRDLQVRYAPHMPLVLRGITCTFKGGLRTGIVGRTGSGKSTLIQTLFRIVEPSAGEIRIDGVNILTIGLHDLRLRLSIIPQDPTMFEGTVRSNLDPLEEYTDDQIWEALDKCQLGDEVRKKEQKLDSSVSENGENWSMGQRQLVCLGRVLLKRSKILVLDEATASVDTATDNLIQKTLRDHFADCTVITIAHRISSVIDSDMVLLLSNGIIEEYDSPVRLLEDKSSSFSKLVAEYTARSSSSID